MDRLISVFSVYDFFSYVFAGGTLVAGCYWAIAGTPAAPGTAAVLGFVAFAYVIGHLVQAVGARWERLFWTRRGGLPSDARLDPKSGHCYDEPFRIYLEQILTRAHGSDSAKLTSTERFALARADLRAAGAEGRSELMNTIYALARGLTTSSALLTVVFAIAAVDRSEWEPFGWAALTAALAAALFLSRFSEFGYRFADQVWKDFAAVVGRAGRVSDDAA
jgi:hypothetical protein